MIFELVKDFAAVLEAMPKVHPRYRILKLLDEAIRRDVHFIERYPTTLFQGLWNLCWWHDGTDVSKYVKTQNDGRDCDSQTSRLAALLECWRALKEGNVPGFAWFRSLRAPQHRLGGALKGVLKGHAHTVASLAVRDFGQLLISGSADRTVRVWDLHDGSLRQTLQATTGMALGESVPAVALSRNEGWIASSGTTYYFRSGPVGLTKGKQVSDRSLRLWNAHTGAVEWSHCGDQIPIAANVSHDRRRCAVLSLDGVLRFYSLSLVEPLFAGNMLDSGDCPVVRQSGTTATGELSVTADHCDQSHTFKPEDFQPILAKQILEPRTSPGQVWWSRNAEHVYVYADTSITRHATFDGAERCQFTLATDENVLGFAGIAEHFLTRTRTMLQIREGRSGETIASYLLQAESATALPADLAKVNKISANGLLVAIGTRQPTGNTVRTFRVEAGSLASEMTIPLAGQPWSISLSEDGSRAAILQVVSDQALIVIDTGTCEELFSFSQPLDEPHTIVDVWLSTSGESIVTREAAEVDGHNIDVIRRYEISSGQLNVQYLIDGNEWDQLRFAVHQVNDNGPIVMSHASEYYLDSLPQHLRVFDAATGGQYAYIRGYGYFIGQPSFANHDQSIVAICSDTTVRTWDTKTGKEGHRIHLDRNLWPDGLSSFICPYGVGENVIVASAQERYLAWDHSTGKQISTWNDAGGLRTPLILAGDYVAYCTVPEGQPDVMLTVRDIRCGQRVASIKYPTNHAPTSLCVSRDGSLVVTGGGAMDPAVRVWNLPEGRLLAEWEFHAFEVLSVTVQAPSGLIASGGFDGTICLWDLTLGQNEACDGEQLERYLPKGKSAISMETGAYGGDIELAVTDELRLLSEGLSNPTILQHVASASPIAWLNAPLFHMSMTDGELHGRIPMQRYEHVYFLEGCHKR